MCYDKGIIKENKQSAETLLREEGGAYTVRVTRKEAKVRFALRSQSSYLGRGHIWDCFVYYDVQLSGKWGHFSIPVKSCIKKS